MRTSQEKQDPVTNVSSSFNVLWESRHPQSEAKGVNLWF